MLTDDLTLTRALAINYAEEIAAMVGCGSMTEHNDPGCHWFSTPLSMRKVNMVLATDLEDAAADAQIARVVDHFVSRRLTFCWRVFEHDRPADLGARLLQAGLTYRWAVPSPLMAADLAALHPADPPAGVTIRPVADAAALRDFYRVMAVSFDTPPLDCTFYINTYTAYGFAPDAASRHYLAYLNGEPVATSAVYLGSGGVAGVYKVTTLPHARGCDIGSAVTYASLRDALGAGYHTAGLFASPLGRPVYERLGFRTVGHMSTYFWQPEG